MIVVDASVLANVLADDEADGDRAREEVRRGGELLAPDLVDVESVAVPGEVATPFVPGWCAGKGLR